MKAQRELSVHPAAARFPMMSEDEMAGLAESINANGLRFPIIVDGTVLIDGRNRLAACKLAGVEPTFEELDGRDPIALIADLNLGRRSLSKGQQAMGYAFLYPEPEKGGRGKKKNSLGTEGFSAARLSQARSVLAFSPVLAQSVFSGDTGLDVALVEVKAAQSRLASDEVKMELLRAEAYIAVQGIVKIGRTLIEAKARIGHGQFLSWIKQEFGWSETTARQFMNVAEQFKSGNFHDLSIDVSALFLSTPPSVPEPVREAGIERGFRTFHQVGTALLKIRDLRLYRATHGTFEEYCRERWSMPQNHLELLMEIAEIDRRHGVSP